MSIARLITPIKVQASTITEYSIIIYKDGDYAVAIDGMTNNIIAKDINHTSVIQSAINYLSGKGGGTIFIKSGNYNISSTINLQPDISIIGENPYTTIFIPTSDIAIFNISNVNNVIIGNFTIDDVNATTKNAYAITLGNAYVITLRDINIPRYANVINIVLSSSDVEIKNIHPQRIFGNIINGINNLSGNSILQNINGYTMDIFAFSDIIVPVGTGNAYGSAVSPFIIPVPIKYFKAKITWGGTFATNETVTVQITVTFNDGLTSSITKSATTVGSTWLTDDDIFTLLNAEGIANYIQQISFSAKSSASTTRVTVKVDVYGYS